MTRVPRPSAVLRLIWHTERWAIDFHPDGGYWSAERADSDTAITYVCGHTTGELADRIDAAERGRTANSTG